ncbi:MAG TPA: hypothetical protein VN730_00900 [Steroidobacteraceae bacterium]|nr:hypothetical protein [Steroidobacteraceae bacterium]
MRETMRDYLKRRYRIALTGVVVGALVLIMAPGSAVTLVLQIVGAIVFGSALLIATLTRCPKCRELFDRRVIAAMVQNSHKPPERCPHCGVNLNAPRPPTR